MAKILKSWSGMRKYLEKEMLADSLQGRVRYNCTTYVGMDGCHIFEVFLDGKLFKQFSWETVNSYFMAQGIVAKPEKMTVGDYWKDFWNLMDEYPMAKRYEYTDNEFAEALEAYRNQDIRVSVQSGNPIVKMFSLLDRRVGNRTLEKLEPSMQEEPEWLQQVYAFRIGKMEKH
ncbi:MAG: hypothetical protein IJK17_00140 [Lachnospiraceae bacterium]|nr:hypothetical protein [Lachnospiraceae bacterium]